MIEYGSFTTTKVENIPDYLNQWNKDGGRILRVDGIINVDGKITVFFLARLPEEK